jgi:lactobin A/cerein 7B family class IIb bacteriocin
MSQVREISSAELTQVEGGCLPLLIAAGLFVLCILVGGAARNISG